MQNNLFDIRELYLNKILGTLESLSQESAQKLLEIQNEKTLISNNKAYKVDLNDDGTLTISTTFDGVEYEKTTLENDTELLPFLEKFEKDALTKMTKLENKHTSLLKEVDLIAKILQSKNISFNLSYGRFGLDLNFEGNEPSINKFLQAKRKLFTQDIEHDKIDGAETISNDLDTGLASVATVVDVLPSIETSLVEEPTISVGETVVVDDFNMITDIPSNDVIVPEETVVKNDFDDFSDFMDMKPETEVISEEKIVENKDVSKVDDIFFDDFMDTPNENKGEVVEDNKLDILEIQNDNNDFGFDFGGDDFSDLKTDENEVNIDKPNSEIDTVISNDTIETENDFDNFLDITPTDNEIDIKADEQIDLFATFDTNDSVSNKIDVEESPVKDTDEHLLNDLIGDFSINSDVPEEKDNSELQIDIDDNKLDILDIQNDNNDFSDGLLDIENSDKKEIDLFEDLLTVDTPSIEEEKDNEKVADIDNVEITNQNDDLFNDLLSDTNDTNNTDNIIDNSDNSNDDLFADLLSGDSEGIVNNEEVEEKKTEIVTERIIEKTIIKEQEPIEKDISINLDVDTNSNTNSNITSTETRDVSVDTQGLNTVERLTVNNKSDNEIDLLSELTAEADSLIRSSETPELDILDELTSDKMNISTQSETIDTESKSNSETIQNTEIISNDLHEKIELPSISNDDLEKEKKILDYLGKYKNVEAKVFPKNEFVVKKEGFLDKFSTREKLFGVGSLLLILALTGLSFYIMTIINDKKVVVKSKEQEIATLTTTSEQKLTQLQKENEDLVNKIKEKEEANTKISGSSDTLTLGAIEKIKVDEKSDPKMNTSILKGKYLVANFQDLTIKEGQKLSIVLKTGETVNYIIKTKINAKDASILEIIDAIEKKVAKLPEKSRYFVLIVDGNGSYYVAQP